MSGTQACDPPFALYPFGGQPLGLPALGLKLALQLRATYRQRTLLRRDPALLDQPSAAALRLARLTEGALCLTQLPIRLRTRLIGLAHLFQRGLRLRAGRLLGLGRRLACGNQPLAFVAPREHSLSATLADLAHLSPGAEQHPPGARRGDPGEAVGKVLQPLEDPRIAEQPSRQLERRAGAAHAARSV